MNSTSINSPDFRLLIPSAQYEKLIEISKIYPEFEPVGVTRGIHTRLATGIKTIEGGIVPVSVSDWDTSLPTVSDLFYIERYSGEKEEYHDEEEQFNKALQEALLLNTSEIIKNQEYYKLIELLKSGISSKDQDTISKVAWYLINTI
jgi:hypothetical protein